MATAVTQPLTPATGTPSTLARTGPAHAAPVLAHADPAAASPPQATSAERLTRPFDDPQLRKFLEASEPQDGDDEKEGSRWRPSRKTVRLLTRLGVVVAIIVAAVLVLRTWIVSPYYIPSESMEPTLHGCGGCNNDRVLVEKISYDVGSIHTGDIVVFNRPKTAGPEITDKVLIKRVIGVGGDQIAVRGGHVFVNSRLLQEPYVKTTPQCRHQSTQPLTATSHWIVPSGDVFVLGDNRCDSIDSRVFGPIPDSSVIGRAFMIYWPFHRIGFLH
jgi:signal peptidase I